jgi:hypothetical protein
MDSVWPAGTARVRGPNTNPAPSPRQPVENGRQSNYTRTWPNNVPDLTAVRGIVSMPKFLSLVGLIVSVLLLLVFAADLALGFPFQGHSTQMDIGFIIAALVLGYLSWTTFREQV